MADETAAAAPPAQGEPAQPPPTAETPPPAAQPGRETSAEIARRVTGEDPPEPPAESKPAERDIKPAEPPQPEAPAKLLKRLGDTERAHKQALQQARALQERLAALEQQSQGEQQDPLGSFLRRTGWDHDRLSQALLERLGGAKPDPAAQALSEVEQLRAQLHERDQQTQAAQAEAQRERQVTWLRDWSSRQGERTAVITTLGLEPLLHDRILQRVRAEGLQGAEVDTALADEADTLTAQWYTPVERQVRTLFERLPSFRKLVLELAQQKGAATPAGEPDSTTREPPLAPPTRRPASATPPARRGIGSPSERTREVAESLRDLFPRAR